MPQGKRRARVPRKPRAKGRKLRRRVSDESVVLAPQTERPRHALGVDRSKAPDNGRIREMSWTSFERHIQGLAKKLGALQSVDVVIGLAHGGVYVGGALAKSLQVDFFPIRLGKRSRDVGARLPTRMPKGLSGRAVLVVDDVAASGETLKLAEEKVRALKARSVFTVSLLAKEDGYMPHFYALQTDDFIVFPWDYEPIFDVRLSL